MIPYSVYSDYVDYISYMTLTALVSLEFLASRGTPERERDLALLAKGRFIRQKCTL